MVIETAPRKKDKSDDQPALPGIDEEKKPETPAETDWEAIRKSGKENQEDLKEQREKDQKNWWDD